MKTKVILLTLCLSLFCVSEYRGQTSVNTSGGDATGPGESSASYTIGETVFTDPSGSGSSTSSQGVQHAYEFIVGIDEVSSVELLLNLYPNPASDIVTLSIGESDLSEFSYVLYDIQGKQLVRRQVSSDMTQIPIEEYADGTYLLEVIQSSKIVKSFTIIKNR